MNNDLRKETERALAKLAIEKSRSDLRGQSLKSASDELIRLETQLSVETERARLAETTLREQTERADLAEREARMYFRSYSAVCVENGRIKHALEITRNELAEHQIYSCRPIHPSVEWRKNQASAQADALTSHVCGAESNCDSECVERSYRIPVCAHGKPSRAGGCEHEAINQDAANGLQPCVNSQGESSSHTCKHCGHLIGHGPCTACFTEQSDPVATGVCRTYHSDGTPK